MRTAAAIANIDVCLALARIAADNDWVLPFLDNGDLLKIEDGRHPVVENVLGYGRFVPNDIDASNSEKQLLIITGPNMSGKSTYIRQAAILTILAQIGSFVPAKFARIGIVDRIFTRIGISDDIAGGRSTFMVEMVETASILNQATSRSLAILDEIGRGTSTYDGLAIARSVAEFIHNSPALGCKTLFATHYHEMTELGETLPRANNLRVAVAEEGEAIQFLYRIIQGGADRSYGIHVAQLAGMPAPVVERARELLTELENHTNNTLTATKPNRPPPTRPLQHPQQHRLPPLNLRTRHRQPNPHRSPKPPLRTQRIRHKGTQRLGFPPLAGEMSEGQRGPSLFRVQVISDVGAIR